MKRISFCILTLLFCCALSAQPYVFYNGNNIIVKTLDSPSVHIDSFAAGEKLKRSVRIHFPQNPGWDFEVPLKTISDNPSKSKATGRMLFLSDIEGEFAELRELLIANNIIDNQYNWIFGKNKLVVCGDLFDRGNNVTEELWLLYKLEADAAAKGGTVHVILGNHDIMNMSGDWRYVQPQYNVHAQLLGKTYGELFDDNTELGKWLRSKHTIEKIGDNLCLHAGVSSEMLSRQLSIGELNSMTRPWYAKSKSKDLPDEMVDFFNDNGLFWYRGYFTEPFASGSLIDSTLSFYNVKRIIVGHTVADSAALYYHGKVVGLDTDWHLGNAEAILVESNPDRIYRVGLKGKREELYQGK